MDIVAQNSEIKNRSDFYKILLFDEIEKDFGTILASKLKADLIDTAYNSSFIRQGEIFRFKSIDKLDALYETIFDSYSHNGKLQRLYNLYKKFDDIKSKIEIIELFYDPTKIVDYVADKLMNSIEDRGVGVLHRTASYIIPRTRLMGIAESKSLLIGVK